MGYAAKEMGSSDNLQSQAIGLIFAFPCLATVAVALRIYSRMLTRSFGAGQSGTSVIPYLFLKYMILTMDRRLVYLRRISESLNHADHRIISLIDRQILYWAETFTSYKGKIRRRPRTDSS